jgi:pilus assembly protein CpaB
VTARRRRGLLLLSVALASGGLAASQVRERERRAAEQLGPGVEVLVAARDLRAGARVERGAVALRRVPARFAPPDALTSVAGVVGARTEVPVAAGSYLGAGLFAGGDNGPSEDRIRRGERAVTIEVAAGTEAAGLAPGTEAAGLAPGTTAARLAPGATAARLAPGARVDVLVSTETGAAGGRTQMALAGAELLRLGEAASGGYPDPDSAGEAPTGPTLLATLRVTVRQAIYLTAADNFAREIRLLPRPPGDRSPAGGAVSQGQL